MCTQSLFLYCSAKIRSSTYLSRSFEIIGSTIRVLAILIGLVITLISGWFNIIPARLKIVVQYAIGVITHFFALRIFLSHLISLLTLLSIASLISWFSSVGSTLTSFPWRILLSMRRIFSPNFSLLKEIMSSSLSFRMLSQGIWTTFRYSLKILSFAIKTSGIFQLQWELWWIFEFYL